ncbi:MAG TPA: hypothetical protein VF017_11985 [Thermoanaerobaculia bacterium]|nr:hypothetical protein [Thermoanaerobaculia bacterium]
MDTAHLRATVPEGAAKLEGCQILEAYTLEPALVTTDNHLEVTDTDWFALKLDCHKFLLFFASSTDVPVVEGRKFEIIQPSLEVVEGLPFVEKWPKGPAHVWCRVPEVEEKLAARAILGLKVMATPFQISDEQTGQLLRELRVDSSLVLALSGGIGIEVAEGDWPPMTLRVRIGSCEDLLGSVDGSANAQR